MKRRPMHRGLSRPLVVLGAAAGGLALTAGLLATLAPAPLAESSLNATVEWRRVEVLASGGSVGTVDELVEASGETLGPCHFVIAKDGSVTATQRWERQLSAAPAYGPADAVSVVLLGDAAELTPAQRAAVDALVERLSQQTGPLNRP